jgi:hypothetical protein
MVMFLSVENDDVITLDDICHLIELPEFDPRDPDCLIAYAPHLKALCNNRTFLGDILMDEISSALRLQRELKPNFSQSINLFRGSKAYLRANFWPSEHDFVMMDNDPFRFFYGVAHDHNFNFLSAGYFGPGYWSDYYEYDRASLMGVAGEKVALKFVGRSCLKEGEVILHEAKKDAHTQLLPESLSISINLVESWPFIRFHEQLEFDVERGEVSRVSSNLPAKVLFALAARAGDSRAIDLVRDVARSHASPMVQIGAIRALVDAQVDVARRAIVLRDIMDDGTGVAQSYSSKLMRDLDEASGAISIVRGSHEIADASLPR